MRRTTVATCLLIAAFALPAPAGASAGEQQGSPPPSARHKPACGAARAGYARCNARIVTTDATKPLATISYQYGYTPSDLRDAYRLPSSGGVGQTIAIVDAYDDPAAEADLNVYRAEFGLGTCSRANGCFRKVDQRGGSTLPAPDTGWAKEISLDIDMAAATCPACKILLVEADSSSLVALSTAVNTAAKLGATVISNSYGGPEYAGETKYDAAYNHPGVAITASSGDDGYDNFGYPAASRYVTTVGGTTLKRSSAKRGWSESAWSKGGSGCSAYEPKPSWQTDTGCSHRMVADVAAVADPRTGVAVYDSFGSSSQANWYVVGGTSASAPIVAGVYALAGNGRSIANGSSPYAHRSALYDIRSGHNGSCSPAYFCSARSGYDGPTGVGVPNGTGAF